MIDKNEKIEIGQHFFIYSSLYFLEYEIIEIQKLVTKNSERIYYIAECVNCNGHENCQIAYAMDEQDNLSYSHMNNEEEYSHHSEPKYIFRTKKEALIHVYNVRIAKCKENIELYKKRIANGEKEMADLTNARDLLIIEIL